MIYFIESLGQIDIAEIHSTAGSYMAVDKFANSIKLMAWLQTIVCSHAISFIKQIQAQCWYWSLWGAKK